MLKYVFSQEELECLNHVIGEKNDISILKYYDSKELSDENKVALINQGIMNDDGVIKEELKEAFSILSQPEALVKFMFTGGVGKYEQTICYDKSLNKHLSFTATPEYYTVDDEIETDDILNIMKDFVGESSLKSVGLFQRLTASEAIVIGTMLDLERRSIIRAFVDELPYTNNRYGFNMIWRMVHSSNSSIQWFAYCFSEVIGEQVVLEQEQVLKVLELLKEKGLVIEEGGQYQLSDDLCNLSNRMIVIDNVLTIETIGAGPDKEKMNAGFTCMQSGIHDLLMIDYNGSEVVLETISSVLLLEYINRLLQVETFSTK